MTEIIVAILTGVGSILAAILPLLFSREYDRKLKALISLRKELDSDTEKAVISEQIHYELATKASPFERDRNNWKYIILILPELVCAIGIGSCIYLIIKIWDSINFSDFAQWVEKSNIPVSAACRKDISKCNSGEKEVLESLVGGWLNHRMLSEPGFWIYGTAAFTLFILFIIWLMKLLRIPHIQKQYDRLRNSSWKSEIADSAKKNLEKAKNEQDSRKSIRIVFDCLKLPTHCLNTREDEDQIFRSQLDRLENNDLIDEKQRKSLDMTYKKILDSIPSCSLDQKILENEAKKTVLILSAVAKDPNIL